MAKELKLENKRIIESEPNIKNVHLVTGMKVYLNEYVLLCIEESLQVYSILKMSVNKPSLISVIALKSIFSASRQECFEDQLTYIFRNVEEQDFSERVFGPNADIKENILLQVSKVKHRITFFNNQRIHIKKISFSSDGDILMLLKDGRCALFKKKTDHVNWQQGLESFQKIDLNQVYKEKITNACIISEKYLCLTITDKICIFNYNQCSKLQTHKFNTSTLNQLEAFELEKESFRICMLFPTSIHLLQVNKKKIFVNQYFTFQKFISQVYFYDQHCFVVTPNEIIKCNYGKAQEEMINSSEQPFGVLKVDYFGNFIKINSSIENEYVSFLSSTLNGVLIGLTTRRNGTYKEGRLLVFECEFKQFTKQLALNIVLQKQYISLVDSIFLSKAQHKKDQLNQFSNLYKAISNESTATINFEGIDLNLQQFQILSLNFAYCFEGKRSTIQKIIEKILRAYYLKINKSLILDNKKQLYDNLTCRCSLTGEIITEEEVLECKYCDLYAKVKHGNRCIACHQRLRELSNSHKE